MARLTMSVGRERKKQSHEEEREMMKKESQRSNET
jgi:hypothetical protein